LRHLLHLEIQLERRGGELPILPDPFPGEIRILKRLRAGSYGEVFLGEELTPLGRLVALKTPRSDIDAALRDQIFDALRRDAQVLGTIRHPNIVAVYSWRTSDDRPWLVMEYVDGGSLDQHRRLNWDLAARYVADVGEGLLMLLGKNIVHRDIKPGNILVKRFSKEARLTDFGVAARLADAVGWAGTFAFMAPEVLPRNRVEPEMWPRADVYSLAATLFRLITGEPPFPVEPVRTLSRRIRAGLPSNNPRYADIPEPLRRIISDGLTADPVRRPELREFVGRLRRTFNHLLTESLWGVDGERSRELNLRLHVSRTSAESRNMTRIANEGQDLGRLRTGDQLRIEVAADLAGFVTVLDVGPTGDLTLLCPDDLTVAESPPTLLPGDLLHAADVKLELPAGREQLVAIWTRQPVALPLADLAREIATRYEEPVSGEYRTSRAIAAVKGVLRQLPPADWGIAIRELEHAASGG
jgi:serine/threonine protein kinase